MGNLAGLVLGSLLMALALIGAAGSLFKIRHWQDWSNRWPEAHPAVSWVLLTDLFVRAIFRDRAMPRSRREAILWEAPVLFISAAVMVLAFALIVFGPADS